MTNPHLVEPEVGSQSAPITDTGISEIDGMREREQYRLQGRADFQELYKSEIANLRRTSGFSEKQIQELASLYSELSFGAVGDPSLESDFRALLRANHDGRPLLLQVDRDEGVSNLERLSRLVHTTTLTPGATSEMRDSAVRSLIKEVVNLLSNNQGRNPYCTLTVAIGGNLLDEASTRIRLLDELFTTGSARLYEWDASQDRAVLSTQRVIRFDPSNLDGIERQDLSPSEGLLLHGLAKMLGAFQRGCSASQVEDTLQMLTGRDWIRAHREVRDKQSGVKVLDASGHTIDNRNHQLALIKENLAHHTISMYWSKQEGYHAVKVLDWNDNTGEVMLYNPWGQAKRYDIPAELRAHGARYVVDGDCSRIYLPINALKELINYVVVPNANPNAAFDLMANPYEQAEGDVLIGDFLFLLNRNKDDSKKPVEKKKDDSPLNKAERERESTNSSKQHKVHQDSDSGEECEALEVKRQAFLERARTHPRNRLRRKRLQSGEEIVETELV